MYRTVTTLYGPAHKNRRQVDHALGRPIYRPWEYFDHDGHLRASNPVEAAKASLSKGLLFLVYIVLAVPVAIYHPVVVVLLLAAIAVAMKASARHYGIWHGECPHCREELWIAGSRRDEKEVDCRICGGGVLLRSGRFFATFARPIGSRHLSFRHWLIQALTKRGVGQKAIEHALHSEVR